MTRDFHTAGRGPALAANAMAATSHPAATLAAIDILRAGGTAMDAAIAAVAVLGVVEPQSTGIGGDCFCLYAPAGQGTVLAFNGSGRAPAAASIDAYEAAGISHFAETSPHAVTIPGACAAWEALLAAHGRLGLDAVLQPAIRLAEDGGPVHPRVAFDWAQQADKLRTAGATSFLPVPAIGDRFAQPALAGTFARSHSTASRAFYEGEIAAEMVDVLRARGGWHTEADFAAAPAAMSWVDPIHARWRGMDVWQCPPNGSGMIVLMMLGLIGEDAPPSDDPLDPVRMHRHLEAARLAYRDRDAFLADPSQQDVPVARLTDPAYLSALRGKIRDDRMLDLPPAGETTAHRDTVCLSVVDRDGNACSLINSLFHPFGSGIVAPRSGVLLQNRGLGFRLQRGHPNCIAPNKRPLHTIIPGMVTRDGAAVMSYGVMGGQYQPMGQSWVLSNRYAYGLDIQAAIDLPRVFTFGGVTEAERGIPLSAIDRLSRIGHVVRRTDSPHGGGQAIEIDRARGLLIGGSDPRKDGMALGY